MLKDFLLTIQELSGQFVTYLLREPALGDVTTKMVKGLGRNIPQMISFVDAVIDLQPWERWANAKYISASETEVNLMSLVWDILGEASTNAIFGSALLGKYPDLLHDVKEMDKGMYYFLMGLPSWFPWPGVMSAHFARARAWKAMDDHQEALDALAMGKSMDSTWGDLDDVSQLVLKRNESFRGNRDTFTLIELLTNYFLISKQFENQRTIRSQCKSPTPFTIPNIL